MNAPEARAAEGADAASETIVSFKGFDSKLQCRGYQYEVGKSYEHNGKVEACVGGFHACEHPLDVLGYYAPGDGSRYALVEQAGTLARHSDDTKVASARLTVKAEIGLPGLVKAAFEYVTTRALPPDPGSPAHSTVECGTATATGDRSASSATGDSSASSATGDRSASSATGYRSASSATGDSSASLTTGWYSLSEIKPRTDDKPVAVAEGDA